MRHSFIIMLLILFVSDTIWAQKLSIGEWFAHLPQQSATQLVDSGEEIYVLTDVYYFSLNKSTGEIIKYDKVWGLSDVQVDHLAYCEPADALIVVYRNTNIDLVIGGNTVVNVSDILRKSISGVKEINSVTVRDSLAYFATTFGIVVFDVKSEEFRDTYIIGDNGGQISVEDVAFSSDSIFAVTVEGVKKATLSGVNLANYQNWQNIGAANGLPTANGRMLEMLGDTLYALFNDSVFVGVNGTWSIYYTDTNYNINRIKATAGKLLVLESNSLPAGRITFKDEAGVWQSISPPNFNVPADALWLDQTLWVADEFQGLFQYNGATDVKSFVPNGPNSFSITGIAYKNGTLWAAPGGADANFNYNFNSSGFYSLTEGFWYQYNQFTLPALQDLLNIYCVATSPLSSKVYFGTFWDGLFSWDGTNLVQYSQNNSSLQGAVGDELRTRVTGLTFDDAGNLWIANHGAAQSLHVLQPDGNMTMLNTPPISFGSVSDIIIDDFNRKWVALPQSTTQGILVYDHGADVASTSDDEYKVLTTQVGNGGLHTNEVLSLAKDKSGQIWVGTTQGISVFYCAGSVLSQGCDAQRIIVSRDGFNGYLLENERINDILVDGADRKWVATNNGLWVFSPDGTEELAYYNEDNSPLLSNNVITLGYDGEKGIMYISTGKGLMSLRTEATEATNEYLDPIEVYPNPVRETFNGTIAIKGLPANAEVRITDIVGQLVYQTQSFGGQAIWDGRDYTGSKAKTGVYFVFSISEDGTASEPTKLLFIK